MRTLGKIGGVGGLAGALGAAPAGAGARRGAELGGVPIGELLALRDLDFVRPPEEAPSDVRLHAALRARPTDADRLRCPCPSSAGAVSLAGALVRVLAADVSGPGASETAVVKEERMRRALSAIAQAIDGVRSHGPAGV